MPLATDTDGFRLIDALLREKDMAVLKRERVGIKCLQGNARKALEYILDYIKHNPNWPAKVMVEQHIRESIPDFPGTLKDGCTLVRRKSLFADITQQFMPVKTAMDKNDPDKAMDMIQLANRQLLSKYCGIGDIVDFKHGFMERIDSYVDRANSKGFSGVSCPWPTVRRAIQGFIDGEFTVFAAETNTGKSWIACIIASHALQEGKNVLFVTMETPARKMAVRVDSVTHKLPYNQLQNAKLTPIQLTNWKLSADAVAKGGGNIQIVDKRTVTHVSDVEALCDQYNSDIVVIDGGYRLKASGASKWEAATAVIESIQLAAEVTEVPWIVTTQMGAAGGQKSLKTGQAMDMWNVRYAREWVLNPDNVIGMKQTNELRMRGEMELWFMKIRNGADCGVDRDEPVYINWDHKRLDFTEAPVILPGLGPTPAANPMSSPLNP